MGRGDAVAVVQVHHDAGAGGFLAGIEMDEAGDVAGGELGVHALLELADGPHDPVGFEQLLFRQRERVGGHWGFLSGLLSLVVVLFV